MTTSYSEDLALTLSLTDATDNLAMSRFEATNLVVKSKPDPTPISDADITYGKLLREILSDKHPSDEVLSEEFGGETVFEGRQWVIDPIDGTKNFVHNVSVWATLIALLEDGRPVVGVVSTPALGRRWRASKGDGTFRRVQVGGQEATECRIEVPKVADIADCSISNSSLADWAKRNLRDNFTGPTDDAWRLCGYGDFFSYCLVAEGAVDIAAEPEVSLQDLAALAILVEEADGRFTSLAGVGGPYSRDTVATSGLLHDFIVKCLDG